MRNNKIKFLPKFIHRCMTIGELPTSYKISLTYEEQLLWFCRFLEEKVIPTVNNNSEVVEELQKFITNFFDNLDLQEEVNNKLEEMLQSGELQEIITSYLEIKGVLGFNTLNDLINATNLIDGSIAKTCGKNTYNDKEGAFYKIREIKNTDVIDGINLIALSSFDNLVAELLKDKDIEDLQTSITTINTNLANLQENLETQITETQENLETQISNINSFNLKPIQNFIYDLGNSNSIQASCADDNYLYIYQIIDNLKGNLLKFSIQNHSYEGMIENVELYHANGMTYKNGKIYSCDFYDANRNNSKQISIYDLTTGTVVHKTPFENLQATNVYGVCDYDEEHLLFALTSISKINDITYMLYNINTEETTNIHVNNKNIAFNNCSIFLGDIEKVGNKVYVQGISQNMIYEYIIDNDTLVLNKMYNLSDYDALGLKIGEIEGITLLKNNYDGKTLQIHSMINERNQMTLKSYLINFDTNLNPFIAEYTENWVNLVRDNIYVKPSSTSLFENGSETYPFKSLERAIYSQQKNVDAGPIIILEGGNYYLNDLTNKNIHIYNSNDVTGINIYMKSAINSNIIIRGRDIFSSSNATINIYSVTNDVIAFLDCNITMFACTSQKLVFRMCRNVLLQLVTINNNTGYSLEVTYGSMCTAHVTINSSETNKILVDNGSTLLCDSVSMNYGRTASPSAKIITPGVK